jgi:hypothetical protein
VSIGKQSLTACKTSEATYQFKWRDNQEGLNLQSHHCENIKSRSSSLSLTCLLWRRNMIFKFYVDELQVLKVLLILIHYDQNRLLVMISDTLRNGWKSATKTCCENRIIHLKVAVLMSSIYLQLNRYRNLVENNSDTRITHIQQKASCSCWVSQVTYTTGLREYINPRMGLI